jgi:acetate---CoA ligase (ADP-forming)
MVDLAALLAPRNVVLLGASDRTGNWSGRVWQNLRRFGFPGTAYLVNPNRQELWGARCYASLADLPEPADHVAVFIPAEASLAALEDIAAAGARSATLYAAGFGEGDDQAGRQRARQLRALIARTGLTVVGPNCMGVAAGPSRFSTYADETLQEMGDGPVAVMAQSGALCITINRAINDLGLRAAYLLSCGNQIGVTLADHVDYLAGQDGLRVLLCYIEHLPDPARFLAAARKATQAGKTVLAIKIGGSDAGRQAALAHTGALAGSLDAFDAYATQAGMVRLDTPDDALSAVEFLARLPRPRGPRIAVMTHSGAVRSIATEAAHRTGAVLPPLSEETRARLESIIGPGQYGNPLDTRLTLPTPQYEACIMALAAASEIDCVLVAEEFPYGDGVARKVSNLRAVEALAAAQAMDSSRAQIALFNPLSLADSAYGRELRADLRRIPVLRGADTALRVVSAIAQSPTSFVIPQAARVTDTSRDAFLGALRQRAARGDTALSEPESKTLLRLFGIPVPPEAVVADADAAVRAAREIGFPVVLKGVSAQVAHKTEAGLVMLGLSDEANLRAAVSSLQARAVAAGLALEGLLVARQIPRGTELLLGVHRDVEMGPVILAGMGGIWLELFRDVAFAPPSIDLEHARAMLQRTRAWRLLNGYRGAPLADVAPVLKAIVALGAIATELGECLESIDINPFIVSDGAWAADALVVLRTPSSPVE